MIFFLSYLVSFMFFLTLSLGALFFILMHYLSQAGWSVALRRIPEHLMANLPVMLFLFIPLLFGIHELYEWSHPEEVLKDPLLQVKAPYLNTPFFIVRSAIAFIVWVLLARLFFKRSTMQDITAEPKLTKILRKVSAPSILLFGITVTFTAIDWIMSLTPHWYSTMYGVYIFAGATVGSLSVMSLTLLILRKNGFLKDIVNVEHYHDLGKLLYGFNIFWAYIAFSQYFLIWYANIPEETEFFMHHFHGGWKYVAILLSVGHFGIPFILCMSRHVKRNLTTHGIMAGWLLIMHFVDIYWLIKPMGDHHGPHNFD